MKVLLSTFDLFRSMGGGQTFYRSLIENNPQIEFHYFIESESPKAVRPKNASAIPFRRVLNSADLRTPRNDTVPEWARGPFIDAENIAASVAGRSFDVVDLPDYSCAGVFLRPALIAHCVQFKSIVLSLHGTLSKSVQMNWGTEGTIPTHLIESEKYQYLSANVRYGISAEYLDECQHTFKISGGYFDPLRFFKVPMPTNSPRTSEPPDLVFVGRTEKLKGPDLFVQLVQMLPRQSYRKARIIGPGCITQGGVSSTERLRQLAQSRGLDDRIVFEDAKTPRQLSEIFAERTLTVLPSKYDTLNLVALESLLSGCPTVIGTGAGAVRYLKESFSEVPFLEFDIVDPARSMRAIEECLENYDQHRERLVSALRSIDPTPSGAILEELYAMPSVVDENACDQVVRWYSVLAERLASPMARKASGVVSQVARVVAKQCPTSLRSRLRALKQPKQATKNYFQSRIDRLIQGPLKSPALLAMALLGADRKHAVDTDLLDGPALDFRFGELVKRGSNSKFDRIRTWNELAKLEETRGNDEIAISYRLRALRLRSEAPEDDVREVVEKLDNAGYRTESKVAAAMFGPKEDRHASCTVILHDRFAMNRRPALVTWQIMDDRRTLETPRVSVIVSLYNAAPLMPRFLNSMALQTLARKGQVEVVLVDSGSPTDEYSVFKEMASQSNLSFVYARSQARETIQSAWNRGIDLARGEYLAFLGVDESLVPNALEILSGELDTNADVDWVTGSSLATEVNADGQWLFDSVSYDRSNYKDQLVLLDTCYLSWVGALYRRSIHKRFGYYDSTFRAAGDTEFKNRVLPHIKTKYVQRQLGVFWNYPAERTTAHPRAEIEDLRAWYLHRTLAGVQYALQGRKTEWAEDLFTACLGYRKSFRPHISTDVDLAFNVAAHLSSVAPESAAARCQLSLLRLQQAYQRLDQPAPGGRLSMVASYRNLEARRKQFALECGKQLGDIDVPKAEWYTDNRYEQHHWVWSSQNRNLSLALPEKIPNLDSKKKVA